MGWRSTRAPGALAHGRSKADPVSLRSGQVRLSRGGSGLMPMAFLAEESTDKVVEVYIRYLEIVFVLWETWRVRSFLYWPRSLYESQGWGFGGREETQTGGELPLSPSSREDLSGDSDQRVPSAELHGSCGLQLPGGQWHGVPGLQERTCGCGGRSRVMGRWATQPARLFQAHSSVGQLRPLQ